MPRLFAYNGHGHYGAPEIVMEYIEGQQYWSYRDFGTHEGQLRHPDDIEVQIKAFPLYIRTMDNLIRNTGMVKPADNKAIDAIIVNRALNAFGDLVIIDWGFVETATSYNSNLFLSNAGKDFMIFPPSSVNPSQSRTTLSLGTIDAYLKGQDKIRKLRMENAHPRYIEHETQILQIQANGNEIKQWLEHAPETPYKLLVQQLFGNEYDPQEFVRNLIEYYSWLDRPQSMTPEERVRRETAYHEIVSWTGARWLEGGVDLAQAQPWIRHLDEQAKSSQVTARSYSERLSLPKPIEQRRPPRTVGIPERGVPEGYISFAEATSEGHIAPTTLYLWVMEGTVPCVNVNGHFYVNGSSMSRSTQDN